MVPALLSNRPDPSSSNSNSRSSWPGSAHDWQNKLDHEQMFKLIDSILSFEACLYHQVLPLSIEGSRLNLGMVNPDDIGALEYVRRIVAYVNYSLVPRQIPSEIHQNMLSAYLNYVGHKKQAEASTAKTSSGSKKSLLPEDPSQPVVQQSVLEQPLEQPIVEKPVLEQPVLEQPIVEQPYQLHHNQPEDADSRATFITDAPEIVEEVIKVVRDRGRVEQPSQVNLDSQEQSTLVTNLPGNLPANQRQLDTERSQQPTNSETQPKAATQRASAGAEANSFTHSSKSEIGAITPTLNSPGVFTRPKPENFVLPVLEVKARNLSRSLEEIKNSPPDVLMHELLGRILSGGIGRLFFERQQYQGRILWSQNGALQSVLEGLAPPSFQGILDELKHLTGIPAAPIQKPRQVEIERAYQASRILLRFRIMPGTYGEEATLQILRGEALKFHQEQQISRLGQDVLSFAKQLQRKLDELDEQAKLEPSILDTQGDALVALEQLLTVMSQKIRNLTLIKRKGSKP